MTKLEQLVRDLETVNEMKDELKRRSMIYQYDEKLVVARHFGLSFAEVDLPYVEWKVLREQYHAEIA
jgi:hypothetical protein